MTILITTLAAAVSATATQISVSSATGITARGANKANKKIIWVDREAMEVLDISGTIATVIRGVLGTLAVAHVIGTRVWVGGDADFKHFEGQGLGVTPGEHSLLTTLTTAGNLTLTPAQIFDAGPGRHSHSIIHRNTSGANRTDTLPTAALLLAALAAFGTPYIGFSFKFTIINDAGAAETITVAAGTGGTTAGTMTIAQNNGKTFMVTITGVDSPAYTVQSMGTVTI